MTYALTFGISGPPALVLEGELHPGRREGQATEGAFTVVAMRAGFFTGVIEVGDKVFLISLPDAKKVSR